MDKESINRRFITVVNYLLESNIVNSKGYLSESLNIKPSKFSEILNNRMNVGMDSIANICELYKIDANWLLTGNGSMLKPEESLQKRNKEFDNIAKPTTNSNEGIPLIPIEAMAGVLTCNQTILEYECERYVVPMFKGADYLIPVKGSSMYPKYNSGDIVACQRVPMSDLFFQWNKVYVIDTTQGPLIKRIKPSNNKDHVLIVSDNEKYDPFELPYSAIHGVAIVIGVIRLE